MKNNKKGFTLVELLAVIAILAILVIIALPNVLNLFKQARINSFTNEVREVYTQARQRYVLDASTLLSGSRVYSDLESTYKLDIQGGGSDFHYCVVITNTGEISEIKVSNGTYYYTSTTATVTNDIKVEDVKEGDNYKAVSKTETGAGYAYCGS